MHLIIIIRGRYHMMKRL